MTEQQHGDTASPLPKNGRFVVIVKLIGGGIRRTWGFASWVSSLILFAVGYLWFPALRTPVTWPWEVDSIVWGPVALMMVLTGLWLAFEVKFTVAQRTTTSQLQFDVIVGFIMATSLSVIAGALIHGSGIEWWFFVPWVGVLVDAMQSAYFGINNAAQKNPTELLKG